MTLTCYSFDVLGVLDLILFWCFRSLSHFGGGGGDNIWIYFGNSALKQSDAHSYGFLPNACLILSQLLIYFVFLLGFFLNVVHTKLTKHRSKTNQLWRAPIEVFRPFQIWNSSFQKFSVIFRHFQRWPEIFIDVQSSSHTFPVMLTDIHKCSAMFRPFQRWPEIFIDV